MSVADGRCDGNCKEETVDKAPVDVLTLFTKTVNEIIILSDQELVNHQTDVWFVYLTVIQLFDMFYNNKMLSVRMDLKKYISSRLFAN